MTRRKREQAKRLTWLTEAQAALGWGVILLLVALLGTIYLNQASRIASIGRRVQAKQNELEALKRENASLERQIAEAQSLERLQQEAIRLGFAPAQPEDIEYVLIPNYPAATREPVAATITPPTETTTTSWMPPETMSEAIWLALKVSINDLVRGEASEG
jgi:cell division protein FtsB